MLLLYMVIQCRASYIATTNHSWCVTTLYIKVIKSMQEFLQLLCGFGRVNYNVKLCIKMSAYENIISCTVSYNFIFHLSIVQFSQNGFHYLWDACWDKESFGCICMQKQTTINIWDEYTSTTNNILIINMTIILWLMFVYDFHLNRNKLVNLTIVMW